MTTLADRRARFGALMREHADSPALVELIQRGLVHAGHDLGDFGPAGDGVDGDPGELTVSAFIAVMRRGPDFAAALSAVAPDLIRAERAERKPITLDALDAALAAVAPTLHDSERTEWVGYLDAAAKRWGIDTRVRLAMWLAQLGHESSGFAKMVESFRYSPERILDVFGHRISSRAEAERLSRDQEALANKVYGGRNGNDKPGDGWKFRGRGPTMLTHAANYREAGRALGIDLEAYPDQVATPEIGAQVAGWFWSRHGLNRHADAGHIVGATKVINGGMNGLADRRRRWTAAKAALGVS